MANPTVVRLLNARADQPLRVMAGTVLGNAKPVSRVADGFYLELNPMADGKSESQESVDVEHGDMEFSTGRILPIVGASEGLTTHATHSPKLALPSILVTPADDDPTSFEDNLSEVHRRYLMQEPDPFSEHCIYLTDEEIWEHLGWDNLEAPDEWNQKFFYLCCAYREIFAGEGNMGRLETVQHCMDTGLADPVKTRAYRMSPEKREFIRKAVKKILDEGLIEPSCSPWSSPIVLVEKKDGDYRFCTDCRRLNAVITKDNYPLPRIDDMLERLTEAQIFSAFDLASGYWQIPLHPPHKEKRHL